MNALIPQPNISGACFKILLVEDNFADAELIEEFLSDSNLNAHFSLTRAHYLSEAINILNLHNFEAIILDISLPDSQGFDTVARVRKYASNIPIVVLTALDDDEIALKTIQAGAQDYLVKRKINSQLLSRSLRYAIERQQYQINGKNRTKSPNKRVFTNVNGNKVVVGIIRDITDFKRQELQKLTSIQQAILNSANYAIISTTVDGTIGLFNPAAERLLGYTAEELVGISTPVIIHDPEEIIQRGDKLSQELGITIEPGFEVLIAKARQGETEEREWIYICKDGSRIPVSLSVTALRNDLGNITGYLGIARDITESKRTEKTLQLSQERLQMALQGSALGYWDWNIVQGTTYFDPQWKKMLGYEIWEVENNYQSWERLIHPEDLPRVLQVLSDYLEGNTQLYEVEFRMSCKSGQWKWIVAQGQVFDRSRSGNPVRMAGTHRDISERKKAEEESYQLARQLQEAQKIAHIGNWEFDVVTGIISWSDELFRIFGRKESKAPNFEELIEQIHPEDRETFSQSVKRSLAQGIPYDVDYRILHPNGEIKYINSKSQALLNKSNQVLRIFGTAMDITDRKQAEEALRQQFLRERLVGTILERIRNSLNLKEVLRTAVEEVRQFLQTDRTIIYRFDRDFSGEVVVESVGAEWTPTVGIDIQDNCFKENYISLYQQGRISAINDIYNADLNQCHIELLTQFQVKANLVVPILKAEKLWGLLIVHHCSSVREWHYSEIESLRQLSVQLAIAIQQSMLFEQAKTEITERKAAEIALRQSEARERKKAIQLEFTLNKLRSTQAQLVQNEKMAALGQLVAGIAHEINNPVTFIYGNINPAMQYASDLLNLIFLYQKYYPIPAVEIANEIEAIDLEFLKKDFQKLLISIQEGASRIKEIVLSLRNFSRLDEAENKEADLESGINSTLLILQNRLKQQPNRPAIQVIKEFGNLPLVQCYPGQLNQVFINILNNAIDAVEEKLKLDSSFTPTIKISTEFVGSQLSNSGSKESPNKDEIIIRISDNGPGILHNVKQRLFDPFFTTKPVGKGTGLGLSISYQIIVEKHRGKLKCNSQVGEGTEFEIVLSTQFASEGDRKLNSSD